MPQESERKRVAVVYHFFANYRRPILDSLARDSRHDFVFVADRVNRVMPGVEVWQPADGIEFQQATVIPLPFDLTLQRGLLKLALRSDIDVIIYLGSWKFISTWISVLIARARGKRVLFWTHGWRQQEFGLRRFIRGRFYKLAHGLLLYGRSGRRFALEQGFSPETLYVVFNSLDHAQQNRLYDSFRNSPDPARLRPPFSNENPILICSCRFKQSKRLDLLIQAAAQLREEGNPVNIILIGDGEERASLEDLANELDVNVFFRGTCFDEEEIARLTIQADVTVCPGATGLTVIQSFSYGVPVVSNDDVSIQGPETEAIVDGVTGALFKANCLTSLVESIKNILDLNPIQKQQMSRACREVVSSYYNPEYQVSVFDDAIDGLPARNWENEK